MVPPNRSKLDVLRAPYRRIRRSGRGPDNVALALEEASRRIADVADAADCAVEEIHARLGPAPEAERPNVIDRERIAFELTKTLLERTESLRAQAAELSRIVDRASTQLQAIESISDHLETRAPARDVGAPSSADFRSRGDQPPAGVRHVARRMAAAGRSREEIAEHLKAEFGVGDVESFLDRVLGAAS